MTEVDAFSSCIPLWHKVALLLVSKIFPGDEFYAFDLVSTVLFNSKFLWWVREGRYLSTNVVIVIDNNYFAHVWRTSSWKLCNLHVHSAVFTTTTTLFYSTNAGGVEQIPDTNQQTKRNMLSNSTGRRRTSRLFTNAKRFELRSTEKQLQLLARVDCSRGLQADCKSSAVTSRPCCLKPRFMCTIAILNDCFIHFLLVKTKAPHRLK